MTKRWPFSPLRVKGVRAFFYRCLMGTAVLRSVAFVIDAVAS